MPVPERELHEIGYTPFILRRTDDHVGDRGEIGQIQNALMRFSVRSDKPRAVDRENNRQILHTDIMHHLVICSLQESRINRNDRL